MEEYRQNHEKLLEIASNDLSTCLKEHHPKCPSYPIDRSDFLPTRLIDLQVLERPRLVISAESQIVDRRYVPLSHHWGKPDEDERSSMTTTNDNFESRQEGFDLASFPKRYQEVFVLCRLMGVRYTWIDSLCIIQVHTSSPPWFSVQNYPPC